MINLVEGLHGSQPRRVLRRCRIFAARARRLVSSRIKIKLRFISIIATSAGRSAATIMLLRLDRARLFGFGRQTPYPSAMAYLRTRSFRPSRFLADIVVMRGLAR